MNNIQKEICNDCLHHKGDGLDITCLLTGNKPTYDLTCPDFVANSNQADRYVMKKHMCKDEYESKGNAWLTSCCCVGVALFVFGAMFAIHAEKYAYVYLLFTAALAIIALGVYVYVNCHSKMHAIDRDIVQFEAMTKQGGEAQPSAVSADPKENLVTLDRIIGFLRDLGYNPMCDTADNGIKWIRILYGETHMFMAYADRMLQVYCPFSLDESTETPEFIQYFLHAANAVMINKRFVQVTGNHGECRFMVSGYVTTMEELRQYLPNYMSIINESVIMHRHYFRNMMQEDAEAAEAATKAEYTPQNNDVVN